MNVGKRNLRRVQFGVQWVTLGLFCSLIMLATAHVDTESSTLSWIGSDALVLSENPDNGINLSPSTCVDNKISIDDRYGYSYNESGSTTACVYDQGVWRYAMTNRGLAWWRSPPRDVSFAIGVGYDDKMYQVENLHPINPPVHVPYTRQLVYREPMANWASKLVVYDDVIDRLVRGKNGYTIRDVDAPDFTLTRSNGSPIPINVVTSSSNGKWLVVEAIDLGIVRVNLETHEIRRVSNVAPRYGLWGTPHMSFSITDDGSYIAIAGAFTPFTIYQVTDTCGDTSIADDMRAYTIPANPCPERKLEQYFATALPSGLAEATNLRFSKDGGQLGFQARVNSDRHGQNQKEYIIQTSGYVHKAQLEYLAMGDSYSSGEGDVTWDNVISEYFYINGTDVTGDSSKGVPDEKCHISTRSYPYLLKRHMDLSADQMKSVACSGAQRIDLQGWTADDRFVRFGYEGQEYRDAKGDYSPRLASSPDIGKLQSQALENYIPGRVQQINFVELYKPNVITVTFGGNDVGFGSIINACVSAGALVLTCNQANLEGGALVGRAIREQYANLRDVYVKLKEASPSAKIYVLGYPQFISKDGLCGLNPSLNYSERELIVEGVSYLNLVIKAAASEAGVNYVDIEDSLGEHVLCGSEESYVNGLGTAVFGQAQESFHPNAKGHKAMYDAFAAGLTGVDETLLNSTSCNQIIICPSGEGRNLPEVPKYFEAFMIDYEMIARNIKMVSDGAGSIVGGVIDKTERMYTDIVNKTKNHIIRLSPLALKPNSLVRIELHSEPIWLGDFTAGVDGDLTALVNVPADVPAGYHTLHVYGESFSGEAVEYYQTIRVHGLSGDIDEDGIPDSIDSCYFVLESGVDEDNDGVDDSCDVIIASKLAIGNGGSERVSASEAKAADAINNIESNTWVSMAANDGLSDKVLGIMDSRRDAHMTVADVSRPSKLVAFKGFDIIIITSLGLIAAIVYIVNKLRKM